LYIYKASHQSNITRIQIGHHIAANHVASAGSASHNAPTQSVTADSAPTTRNMFFAVSGFCFARFVKDSRYGNNVFIQSTSISSNHHSITFQSANHQSAARATPMLSFIVDITPENVADFLSIIPKNNHHSDVASIIVCFTISKLICQFSIFSRSEDIDSPVLSDIAFNGLNHKLIS
jgi:hypothetical protein